MSKHEQNFVAALRSIMEVIENDYKGMIIGGMAVIALGYPRVTTDVDATVLVGPDIASFTARLKKRGIIPRVENAVDFAKKNHVLLMRHQETGIDIDISLAMLPFEEEAISNCQVVDFAGVKIAIPRVEDMIIYKMVAYRPEDLRDVEELLLRYIGIINVERVKTIVTQFSEVLECPEIMSHLEALIKKTA